MGIDQLAEDQLPEQACLLLYDGECRLCIFAKAQIDQLRVGRQSGTGVRFLTYQSDEAKLALGREYRPGRPETAFLIRPSGEVIKGLDAFLPLVPNFPGGKLLLWWLGFPSAKRLAEWGYRMIARHRYQWFGEAKPPS
ncbi:MAG: thiol-disulfide oxidoreductase DCC family protein [Nitrospira sp.]